MASKKTTYRSTTEETVGIGDGNYPLKVNQTVESGELPKDVEERLVASGALVEVEDDDDKK